MSKVIFPSSGARLLDGWARNYNCKIAESDAEKIQQIWYNGYSFKGRKRRKRLLYDLVLVNNQLIMPFNLRNEVHNLYREWENRDIKNDFGIYYFGLGIKEAENHGFEKKLFDYVPSMPWLKGLKP